MKLVTRLTAAFLLVVLIVISAHEYRWLRQERTDYERDMDRTHQLVATTLVGEVERLAPRAGMAEALRTVEATELQHVHDLRLRWVCLTGHPDPRPPALPCAVLKNAEAPVSTVRSGADGTQERLTLAAVHLDGIFAGAIEVSEAPGLEANWATRHLREALLLAVMTILATTAAAFILGWWLVARPTRLLVEKARAVGRGELEPNLQLDTGDELGFLAEEMNAMCLHLREVQDAAAKAAAARLQAVEQLRHADRLATVGRVASGLAHELGTPLNVVEARAGLIIDDPSTEPSVRSSAEVIIRCADQMTKLVRQLLVFARQRQLEMAPLKLDAFLSSLAEMVRPLASKQQLTLVADDLVPVVARADAVLLQQAVTNLVLNALQASRTGGSVRVGTALRRVVRPGTQTPGNWCVLWVSDDGAGMAPDILARIFEPFFTTKPPGEGTGLGLAVTWGIVEDHGGWISVESEASRGSTFTLHLPEAST